ncbi:hypothetical protein P0D75_07080 [Paraburkholderia sediminicola]|uniref:hypothetical protein n=1 Tax=Paraburkholderia sediminicola TaxID=458836 RepID=UPI0038B9A9BC
MKSLFVVAACVVALAHPIASFAQSDAPEGRALLTQPEATGHTAGAGNTVYSSADPQATDSNEKLAYGGTMSGVSQSGRSADVPPAPGKTQHNPLGIYFGN